MRVHKNGCSPFQRREKSQKQYQTDWGETMSSSLLQETEQNNMVSQIIFSNLFYRETQAGNNILSTFETPVVSVCTIRDDVQSHPYINGKDISNAQEPKTDSRSVHPLPARIGSPSCLPDTTGAGQIFYTTNPHSCAHYNYQNIGSGSAIAGSVSLHHNQTTTPPNKTEGRKVRHPTRRESQERFPAGTQLHKLAYGCVAFPYPVSLSEGDLPGRTSPAFY
jgi:hypothetical protein